MNPFMPRTGISSSYRWISTTPPRWVNRKCQESEYLLLQINSGQQLNTTQPITYWLVLGGMGKIIGREKVRKLVGWEEDSLIGAGKTTNTKVNKGLINYFHSIPCSKTSTEVVSAVRLVGLHIVFNLTTKGDHVGKDMIRALQHGYSKLPNFTSSSWWKALCFTKLLLSQKY